MAKRIGILTGGGDCPGLNAVIRAVTKHAIISYNWDVIGIEDGFQGLYEKRYQPLTSGSVRGLLVRGGTILGSSNRANPFRYPIKLPDGREEVRDVSEEVLRNLAELELEALVAVGGDGTMQMAQGLLERGARIVGVPKTIDNDLSATDFTFGYQTAVEIATEAVDRLHTTAESHDRIILCEVMGRYAGWIAMAAGLAGGADVILIPEIPYRLERIVSAIEDRKAKGITFSIIVVAEGAKPLGGESAVAVQGDLTRQEKLGGAADRLARELARHFSEHDVRVTVLGHVQRGGTPTAFDRLLGTRYGTGAVDLVAEGKIGQIVALRGNTITSVPIKDACGQLKLVDPRGELARVARHTGVELGA
ncbi:MAG: ATP-dependent 6-phosphofructokinase [Deltaproteobacteria bacterium]|nr:ATP-dependent 6-phosphofructokinase [Deltaproteobacteria bacterium]